MFCVAVWKVGTGQIIQLRGIESSSRHFLSLNAARVFRFKGIRQTLAPNYSFERLRGELLFCAYSSPNTNEVYGDREGGASSS
jgi:hypothetical protein